MVVFTMYAFFVGFVMLLSVINVVANRKKIIHEHEYVPSNLAYETQKLAIRIGQELREVNLEREHFRRQIAELQEYTNWLHKCASSQDQKVMVPRYVPTTDVLYSGDGESFKLHSMVLETEEMNFREALRAGLIKPPTQFSPALPPKSKPVPEKKVEEVKDIVKELEAEVLDGLSQWELNDQATAALEGK